MRTILLPDLVGDRPWVAPGPIGYVEGGWRQVVEGLLDALGAIVAAAPDYAIGAIDFVDVAERDGALVCDLVVDPRAEPSTRQAVDEAVATAAARCSATCARCGAPGRLRLDRAAWPTTRCDAHAVPASRP